VKFVLASIRASRLRRSLLRPLGLDSANNANGPLLLYNIYSIIIFVL